MDGVQVWWGWVEQVRENHTRLLDVVERGRWERYRSAGARAQFTAGCAITRLVLADLTGRAPDELVLDRTCPRCGQPHGKPRLVDGDIRFSVSHSGGRVGVAFSRDEVGLDVERIATSDRERTAELVLAPGEWAAWRSMAEPERTMAFHTYWVRKESVLKATGDGLSVPMSELLITAPGAPPEVLAYPGDVHHKVSLYDLAAGAGYAAALAVLGAPADIVIHDAAPILAR